MWIFKDIIIVVGCVIMTVISIIGFIGVGFDIQEIHNNISRWNITWFELCFLLLAISFLAVVIRLIIRLNKYEKAKPKLENRAKLIEAIHNLLLATKEKIAIDARIEQYEDKSRLQKARFGVDIEQLKTDRDKSWGKWFEASHQYSIELAVAGLVFKEPLLAFKHIIDNAIIDSDDYSTTLDTLDTAFTDVEDAINSISN